MHTNNDTERTDLLISHIIDGEASAAEWSELETLAQAQPRLWRELAEAQRDGAALRGALRFAGDLADRTPLPADARMEPRMNTDGHGSSAQNSGAFLHPQVRFNRFGAWTGWLVAAMVIIVASLQLAQQAGPTNTAGIVPTLTSANPDQLREEWLKKGQQDGTVLGEVPGKMLVDSRPLPNGQGFEVICVRQVVERAVVPDLYQINGVDEGGQPTLKRYRQPVRKTM